MTDSRRSYDPYRLIREVAELLHEHGLSAEIPKGNAGIALGGAGMLLRAFEVEPSMEAVDAYAHSLRTVWSDEDGLDLRQ